MIMIRPEKIADPPWNMLNSPARTIMMTNSQKMTWMKRGVMNFRNERKSFIGSP